MADVIVIAGTVDARQIIEELNKIHIKTAATVATMFGSKLIKGDPDVTVYEGRMTSKDMIELIGSERAKCLVDASHPFAKDASLNAMEACHQTGIKYIRFERSTSDVTGNGIIRVKDFNEAAEKAAAMDGNILLTIGSNHIGIFTRKIKDYKERIFVRVLPESQVIKKCEDSGLTAKNIIALKGPFSEKMNLEMMKYCNAKVMITKESGDAGGLPEKVNAATSLGATVIMVERPKMFYTDMVSRVEDVVSFVRDCLK